MTQELYNSLPKISRKFAETMDDFIITFFGSEEAAKSQLHLYVLEEYPKEFQLASPAFDGDSISYTVHQQYRLRRKTEEELELEGNNEG